ncbi:hypothetical protein SAMN05443247_05415 [Bradyrhizobium erythrophlei]|nr:hypothetical protein SAMN05443247_05415 [Bradyrhizobium erythrophlei]
MTFKAFTREQWNAIRAVRDDWPEGIDWEEVRRQLVQAGQEFWHMRAHRLRLGPPAKLLGKLRGAMLQIGKLQTTLKALPENFVRNAPDPYVELLQQELQKWLETYEYFCGPAFRGRKYVYRDFLYANLLYVWIGPLSVEPSFSRKLDNTPCGPMIDFYTLTLKAILGKAPGPSRIAKIIERRRSLARKTSPFGRDTTV